MFENCAVQLVQVTGAGLDRLDQAALKRRGIAVANVPGGNNSAVAEYAVTAASVLLHRVAWANAEIRGGIVDEAALVARLESGRLAGAAIDVYSRKPPDATNPLLTVTGEAAGRLLLTPHIAGITRQSSAFLFKSARNNVERVLVKGEAPLYRAY